MTSVAFHRRALWETQHEKHMDQALMRVVGPVSVKNPRPKKHSKTPCLQKAAILQWRWLWLLPPVWWSGWLLSHSPPSAPQSARWLLFPVLAPELIDRHLATDMEMQVTDENSLLCIFSLPLTKGRGEHAFMSLHCYL